MFRFPPRAISGSLRKAITGATSMASVPAASPSTASTCSSKYRFSAVDDLQLPPALSVTTETPLATALTLALEREYSQLTVISPERRKLLGYLDVPATLHAIETKTFQRRPSGGDKGKEAEGKAVRRVEDLTVRDMFTRFDRRKSLGYQVITPDTSLDILDEFLQKHDFAIGRPPLETRLSLHVVLVG